MRTGSYTCIPFNTVSTLQLGAHLPHNKEISVLNSKNSPYQLTCTQDLHSIPQKLITG